MTEIEELRRQIAFLTERFEMDVELSWVRIRFLQTSVLAHTKNNESLSQLVENLSQRIESLEDAVRDLQRAMSPQSPPASPTPIH